MKTIHFKVIDSTNKYLKDNYQSLDNMTFVSADYQTKGRGREDRVWSSNKKENLMFSVLIKDKDLTNKYASISLLSGYVIFKVLKHLNIDNVSIKWPNDVYINDKKVCGILMEGVSKDNGIEALVVGIGLNINQESFENEPNAVSIRQTTQKKYIVRKIRKQVYKCLKLELSLLKENKSNYLNEVRANNFLYNKKGTATINGEKVLVKVLDINDDNSIKVEYNGSTYDLSTGEITFHQ